MKRVTIYFIGCGLWAPVVALFMSENVLLLVLGIILCVALMSSPLYSKTARRFWRMWHRTNFYIINIIK